MGQYSKLRYPTFGVGISIYNQIVNIEKRKKYKVCIARIICHPYSAVVLGKNSEGRKTLQYSGNQGQKERLKKRKWYYMFCIGCNMETGTKDA